MTILRLDFEATPRQGSMSIPSTDCECCEAPGAQLWDGACHQQGKGQTSLDQH